jgi:hypothetical protein
VGGGGVQGCLGPQAIEISIKRKEYCPFFSSFLQLLIRPSKQVRLREEHEYEKCFFLSISAALNARLLGAKRGTVRPSVHTSFDAPLLMMYADKICEKSQFW